MLFIRFSASFATLPLETLKGQNVMDRKLTSKRARKRNHYDRIKRKRLRYLNFQNGLDHSERRLGKLVSTPKPCSCYMCGNPRKYWGEKTLREIECTDLLWEITLGERMNSGCVQIVRSIGIML